MKGLRIALWGAGTGDLGLGSRHERGEILTYRSRNSPTPRWSTPNVGRRIQTALLVAYCLSALVSRVASCSADLKPACWDANRRALDLSSQARLQEAAALLSEALTGLTQTPENRLCAGTTLANLANLRLRTGELQAAKEAATASIVQLEQTLGSNSARLLDPLGVLANVAILRERFNEASELISRGEKLPGASHRDIATTQGLRALLMMRQGRDEEAEKNFRLALGERELAGQQDSPEAFPELWNLGGLYMEQGRIAEALSLFQRCLRVSDASPFDPVMKLGTLLALGVSYAKLSNREMAANSFDRATNLVDFLPSGFRLPLGRSVYYQYARFLRNIGQKQRAKNIDEAAERLFGKDRSGMTVALDSLFPKSRKH